MPVEYSPQQTFQAVAESVTGYALNQFDWSVVVPEGTLNYFSNPSFENSSVADITLTSATGARVTTESVYGLYSYQVTPTGILGASLALNSPGAKPAGAITGSTYVKGTRGELFFITATDPTNVGASSTTTFTATGLWQRVSVTSGLRAVPSTSFKITVGKTSPTTNVFYVDAFQLESKSYMTTYCDGTRGGCSWSGPTHASASYRAANGGGGREYRLTDLGFKVLSVTGHDMPPYEAQVQQYGLVGGQQYQRTVPKPQIITLSNVIEGLVSAVTRQTKDRIIELLAPYSSQYQDRQLLLRGKQIDDCQKYNPVQIGPTLEIPVRVAGDLSGVTDNYNQERFALSFVCDNPPAVVAVFEKASTLLPRSTITFYTPRMTWYKALVPQYNSSDTPYQWTAPGQITSGGVGLQLTALAVAGAIPSWGTVAGYGATWDGTNGKIARLPALDPALSAGHTTNGIINSFLFDNQATTNIYVGGAFLATPFPYIFKSDGTTASVIGTTNRPNNVVRTLLTAQDASQNLNLYAFGDFVNSGTRWGYIGIPSGTTWTNPTGGAGFNAAVQGALLLQNRKFLIYGDFTTVDGGARNRIVIYDPITNTFSSAGGGFANGSVRSAVQLPNGDIVFGGTFTATTNGLTTNYVAVFNGSQILPLGLNVFNAQINSVSYEPVSNTVYVAGNFAGLADALGGTYTAINCYARLVGDYWLPTDLYPALSSGSFAGAALGALYLSTGAVSAGTSGNALSSVSYDGSADAYPIVIIRGAATPYSITNLATGATIYFNQINIASSEVWTLSFGPTGLVATSNLYGDVSRYITGSSDFTGFALVKRNTTDAVAADYTNILSLQIASSNNVEIYWRTTFQGFSATSTALYNGL